MTCQVEAAMLSYQVEAASHSALLTRTQTAKLLAELEFGVLRTQFSGVEGRRISRRNSLTGR